MHACCSIIVIAMTPYNSRIIVCLRVRFVNAQVYFGVSLGSVLLGGNIYLNFFLTSLVELPGNAFAIWSMDR